MERKLIADRGIKQGRNQEPLWRFGIVILVLGIVSVYGGLSGAEAQDGTEDPSPDHNRDADARRHYSGDSPPREDDPRIASPTGHRLNAQEVDSVSDKYGLSDFEARRLISMSSRSGWMGQSARQQFPTEFAGIWIEHRPPRVVVAFTSDVEENVQRLREQFPDPSRIVGVQRDLSHEDLAEAEMAVRSDREDLHDRLGVMSWQADARRGELIVEVLDNGPETEKELKARYSHLAPVVVKERARGEDLSHPPSQMACEYVWTSCNPLRGGTVLHLYGESWTEADCTLGFNAHDSDGKKYVFTAGHCSDSSYWHSESKVGAEDRQQNGGHVDVQRLPVETWWDTSRWVLHDGSSLAQAYQMQGVYHGPNLSPGATLCVTGAASKTTYCEDVTDGDWEGYLFSEGKDRWYWNLVRFNGCGTHGDSGAPIYAGYTAYGILKGKINDSCDLVASYIENVENEMLVDVTVN